MENKGRNPFVATLIMLGITVVALLVGVANSVIIQNYLLLALNLVLVVVDSVFFGIELQKCLVFCKLREQEREFREIVKEIRKGIESEPFGEFNNDKGEE